ncbi:MAG TPA: PepSY-associated TM helix domain-containing protein, partial [Steroidobacteraceae bacterium]
MSGLSRGVVVKGEEGAEKRLHSLRRWAWIHKWSSLVCTAFLLVICVTGLPLLFSDEIDHWLDPHVYEQLPESTPAAPLDGPAAAARRLYPGQVVTSIFIDDDEPQVIVSMAPSWAADAADRRTSHFMRFDARTGALLEKSKPAEQRRASFMGVMLALHRDLFVDLPGELFLGLMALLFVIAIISGVVLYEPFTRKIPFGTVRRDRSRRLKWLDLHNLLGVVTVAWALVVGLTGVMNELSTPLFGLWRLTDVQATLRPWQGQTPPPDSQLSSVQGALDTTRRALPGMTVTSIVFPGNQFGSPHHYVLWAKGNTRLTSRLFNPVLVDAQTGKLTAIVKMPWYLRALEISRPLHFGDYGGYPLKVIWAL